MPDTNANIARHLGSMAAARPAAAAVKVPRGRTRNGDIDYLSLTFSELDSEVAAWCSLLARRGVRRGDRALLMVRPGLPLIAACFALFRIGAVPIVIDPGMGLGNFLKCVERTRPRALVGIGTAQLLSRILRRPFQSVEVRVPVSGSLTARLGAQDLGGGPAAVAQNLPGDLAAILFTSGSTGTPKGVCYQHGMFEAQVRLIRAAYGIEPGEVDLPLLPVFALFDPAFGMTAVIPEVDPRRPASADPAAIVQAIRQENVTNSFGSPTLWGLVASHCRKNGITLPSLRRVLCAGAPVPDSLWAEARWMLPNGRLHSPYGASEALPVCSIDDRGREEAPRGPRGGACVGSTVTETEVRIMAPADGPVASLDGIASLPAGQIGEIIVRGPAVTESYDALPGATAAAKIRGGDGSVWHRMGDCGYLDKSGRLWFCGRKAERVLTPGGPIHTEPCEQVFRAHPAAARCALIGLGPPGLQEPALVVEARPTRETRAAVAAELRGLARATPATAGIRKFYFRKRFPVDVRHNAKIHRLALARWAAARTPIVAEP